MNTEIKWFDSSYKIEGYSDYENGRFRVKKSIFYGLIDLHQNIIIPPVYGHIEHFDSGVAKVKMHEGEYYYINEKNETVISAEEFYIPWGLYEKGIINRGKTSEKKLITVGTMEKENRKWGFCDTEGNVVIDLVYEDISAFSNGLALARKDGLYGYIDESGNVAIPFCYSSARSFEGDVAKVAIDKQSFVIDRTGREIIKPGYDFINLYWGGLSAVLQDDKWGVFDSTGKQIVPFIYDGFTAYNCDGYAEVVKDGKHGLIDKDGKLVIPMEYEYAGFFNNGFAEIQIKKRNKGFISKQGKILAGFSSVLFGFSEGLAAVKKKGKWGFIDEDGNEVIPPQYIDTSEFSNGIVRVMNEDGKCGYVNRQNEVIVPFEYDWMGTFDGKNHTFVINGFNPVFHLSGSRKEGLVDNKGKLLLPVIYDSVICTGQDGIVLVKLDGKWGFVEVPFEDKKT